jgi:deoxyribodipyrimidine photo-lyase
MAEIPQDFFDERYHNYSSHISKPLLARKVAAGCLYSLGNLSSRQVYKSSHF